MHSGLIKLKNKLTDRQTYTGRDAHNYVWLYMDNLSAICL